MSHPYPPAVPPPSNQGRADEPGIRDVDGEEALDPDVDDRLIDSAEADRLAAEEPRDDD